MFRFVLPTLLLLVLLTMVSPIVPPSSPLIVLKIAVDANGFIGSTNTKPSPMPFESTDTSAARSNSNPNNFRFTAPSSLDMVHRLRSRCHYVVTGSNTVIADNPSFSCRRNVQYSLSASTSGPTRVVVDRRLKTLSHQAQSGEALKVLHPSGSDASTILYHSLSSAPSTPPFEQTLPRPAHPVLKQIRKLIGNLFFHGPWPGGGLVSDRCL